MDILAVIPHRIASQGYMRSQVVAPLAYLSSSGLKVALLCILDEADEKSKGFEAELLASGIKGYFVKPSGNAFLNYINCAAKAAGVVKKDGPSHIYAREVWGGLGCLFATRGTSGKTGFVYDFRGAVPEEILFYGGGTKARIKAFLFSRIEKVIAKKAWRLNAVTHSLSSHLLKKYGRAADTVIPCCSFGGADIHEKDSAALRSALGFSRSDKVYVYSGSLNKWQMFDETVRLFSMISAVDDTARLLVLTPDIKMAESVLGGSIKTGAYAVRSVRQDEVTSYLAAGDFGFLLREDNIVNHVAFPIKFAEYIAAGLAIITTEGVSEIARIVRSEGSGYVIDLLASDAHPVVAWSNEVMRHRDEYRKKAFSYAKSTLLWPCHIGSFGVLYGVKHSALRKDRTEDAHA
ncbi:MAG: hypothetical protein HY954_10880 [Deltaproteobacteria bacterium]|nr:hypothetical protein [Deltaproteobacteria bacterium]